MLIFLKKKILWKKMFFNVEKEYINLGCTKNTLFTEFKPEFGIIILKLLSYTSITPV